MNYVLLGMGFFYFFIFSLGINSNLINSKSEHQIFDLLTAKHETIQRNNDAVTDYVEGWADYFAYSEIINTKDENQFRDKLLKYLTKKGLTDRKRICAAAKDRVSGEQRKEIELMCLSQLEKKAFKKASQIVDGVLQDRNEGIRDRTGLE